jgi:hypothetical protein
LVFRCRCRATTRRIEDTCVDASGKLGYVQGVGAAPGAASATSSQPYAIGAFLLAGAEVAKW